MAHKNMYTPRQFFDTELLTIENHFQRRGQRETYRFWNNLAQDAVLDTEKVEDFAIAFMSEFNDHIYRKY